MSRGLVLSLITILVAADQATKWIVESMLPMHQKVDVIPFLAWFRTHNEGVAFSLLSDLDDRYLIVGTLIIICIIVWLWIQSEQNRNFTQWGFLLILAGAIGNLIDRVWLGYVVDFVLVHTQNWSFAIFNLADSMISVGAACIILDEILEYRRKAATQ